jgi:uncharacterized protein
MDGEGHGYSGMTDFRSALRAYLAENAKPRHKFGHQARLYALTREIGDGLAYDDDVVYAAAWLHDLGVFVGHRPEDPTLLAAWDHVAYTTGKAPELLRSMGFPEAKMEAVLDAIRTHQPHDHPQSIEAVIVRDADILEQLGAMGVLRTVSKVGNDTRFALFEDARRSLEKALERLPPMIRLESTRRLAAPRIAAMRAFLDAVDAEAAGELG